MTREDASVETIREEAPWLNWSRTCDSRRAGSARTPGFTLLALVTLSLGIGANTALFSVVHAVLLKPLPFSKPDELYSIWSRHTSTDRYPFSLPEFCDYRDGSTSLAEAAALANWSGNLAGEGATERHPRPAGLGQLLRDAGRRPGPRSHPAPRRRCARKREGGGPVPRLWQRRFGGDPGVVGRPVTLNGEPYTVVGVLAAELPASDPGRRPGHPARARAGPVAPQPRVDELPAHRRPGPPGRRRRPRSRRTWRRSASGCSRTSPARYARKKGVRVMHVPRGARPQLRRDARDADGRRGPAAADRVREPRQPDAGARHRAPPGDGHPPGPGRAPWRLARELLVEAALLSFVGAGLGVLLAYWAVPALVALSPTAMPRLAGHRPEPARAPVHGQRRHARRAGLRAGAGLARVRRDAEPRPPVEAAAGRAARTAAARAA